MYGHKENRTVKVKEISQGKGKRKLVEPLDNIELFKHCAGGMMTVTSDVFESTVWPLLMIHGVSSLRTE